MGMTEARLFGLAITAAFGMLIIGCGGGSSEEEVEVAASPDEAVSAVFAAGAARDYTAVCDLLTEEAQKRAIKSEGVETCEEAQEAELGQASPETLNAVEVGAVTEDGDTATVEVTYDGQPTAVQLLRIDGEWKLNQ